MLNLTFVDSEFSFGGYKIDTLAFDDAKKIFVIIEYKIKEDKRTINQVFGYLGKMMTRKSNFLLVYNNKIGKLRSHEVDWDNTRVLLIAPKFHDSMLNALLIPNVKFELWKIHYYKNGYVEFKQLKNINNHIVETCLSRPRPPSKCLKSHLKKCNKNIKRVYEEFNIQIRETFSDAKFSCTKSYVSFKQKHLNFIRIRMGRDVLFICLPHKLEEMHISQPSVLTMEKKRRHYGGNFQIAISEQSDIMPLMELVKQSYDRTLGIEPIQSNSSTTSREHEILSECNADTRALYDEIKNQILKLGSGIDVYGTKYRIVFKAKRSFVRFRMSKTKMRVYPPITDNELQRVRVGNLDAEHDSRREVRVMISDGSEIPSLMRLVEYSYNRHADNSTMRVYQGKS